MNLVCDTKHKANANASLKRDAYISDSSRTRRIRKQASDAANFGSINARFSQGNTKSKPNRFAAGIQRIVKLFMRNKSVSHVSTPKS